MKSPNQFLNWILFVLICLIWGSSFILMKEGLRLLSPYQVASIRVSTGALVLIPFAFSSYKKIPRKKIPLIFLTGFLGTFAPAFLFCIAETRIDSALTGILNALTPMFTLTIGTVFFRSHIPAGKWIGVIVGFIGLTLLLISGNESISFHFFGYSLLVVLATASYGLNVNIVNKYLHGIKSLDIAAVSFSGLLLPALVVLFSSGFSDMGKNTAWFRATGASVILGVFGTAAGTLLFYSLLKKAGPVFSSMVTYGIPFVALGWGLLDGETISFTQVISLLVILAGVYMVNRNKPVPVKPAEQEALS